MNKYDISAKRLHIFDIKNWFSSYFTSRELVDVDFYKKRNLIRCSDCRVSFHSLVLRLYKSYHNFDCSLVEKIKLEIELTRLQSHIQAKAEILAIELFKQKKAQSTEQKIQEQTQREVKLTEYQIKWETKKRAELIEQKTQQEVIEISNSTSISVDIDIFDSTLICDILKFDLYNKVMNFLQHFQQTQHQYRKQNVFDLLFKCFREFAFAWFKDQIFNIIQNFDKNLTYAFFIISFEFTSKSFISSCVSHFSFQYHLCVECFAQFSSMTRLLKHIKQVSCSKVICKHCEQNFNFKNKFHEHIREQHTQKSNINSNFRFSTSEFTYKIMKKSTIICSSVSLASSIFFATSRSQIFSTKSVSRSVSSNDSHLSIATFNITSKQTKITTMLITRDFTSKRVEIATFNCSFTVSSIFFATSKSISWFASIFESISSKCSSFSIATHRITSKSMKKLSVNSFTSSISFSRTSVSKHQKFYFIIDDLIRMFHEKSRSFDLRQHQKDFASSQHFDTNSFRRSRFFMHQSRIISYLMSAVNQKTSISQSLKNSNSKSFQQFTFAKTIRFVLSEKSIISSYKKSDIFYISLRSKFSFLQSRFSFAWFRFTFSFASSSTFSSFFRSRISDYVCCICFDHFNFRNDSFSYRRSSQRYLSNRRSMREERND